jgi:small subunit ribosomal protein S2
VSAESPAETPPRELSVRSLLEAGAHFGHQTRRWDPRMKPFIFGERHGVHILDLDQTAVRFRAALDFLRETVASGGKVLFVGTKRQAQAPIKLEAESCKQFYVNNRWLGGMLTNFRTVKRSIERFKDHLALVGDEEKANELSKKELSRITRSIAKYEKSLEGIKEMSRLPDALFVIDVTKEHIALSEAQRLGIPIVAIVDSNANPEGIDYVIPANDDAIRALNLYCGLVADACREGAELHNERVQSEVSEQAAGRRAEAPSTGRRVVEIKQPPRRGRGAGGPPQRRGRRPEGGPPPSGAGDAVEGAEHKPEPPAVAPAETGPAES